MPGVTDAVVIGSGPNGLAAAIVLAQAGRRVTVFEAASTLGGGLRSAELTLPGFVHDIGAAILPAAVASPFFRSLPLSVHRLDWIEPPAMVTHPFDDGTAAVVFRSLERTATLLQTDADAYRHLLGRIVADWPLMDGAVLGPLQWPRHRQALARFGFRAFRPAKSLARRVFVRERARGLFAGFSAHSMLPLDRMLSGGFGLVLGAMAHVAGWLLPRRGLRAWPTPLLRTCDRSEEKSGRTRR